MKRAIQKIDRKWGNKDGFTLAETLLTLGIIGILAGLTIPTLLNNIRNQQLKTAFNKGYAALSQAILYMKNNDGPIWAAYNYQQNGDTGTLFYTNLMKNFSIIKDCNTNSCVPDATYYKNFTNDSAFINGTAFKQGQFITSDGMFVATLISTSSPTNVLVFIDVNGYQKKPNRAGYDLFGFQIMPNDTLIPLGATGTTYLGVACNSNPNNTLNGIGCAAKAVTDSDYFKNLP